MTTLENLWYDNIRPVEQFVEGNAEYKSLLRLAGNNREKLEGTLAPRTSRTVRKILHRHKRNELRLRNSSIQVRLQLGSMVINRIIPINIKAEPTAPL